MKGSRNPAEIAQNFSLHINALVEEARRSIEAEIRQGTLQIEDDALQRTLEIFRQTLESAHPLPHNAQSSRPSSVSTDTSENSTDGSIPRETTGSTLFQASGEASAPPDVEKDTGFSLQGQDSAVVPYNEPSSPRHVGGDNDILEPGNTACSSSSSGLPSVSNLSLSGSIGNSYPSSSAQAIRNDSDMSEPNIWPLDPSQYDPELQQDSMDPFFDLDVGTFDPDPSFFSQDPECQMESLGISADSQSYPVEDVGTYLNHPDTMVELLHNENEDPRATAAWEKKNEGNRFLQNW
jgi:hypothetical protein